MSGPAADGLRAEEPWEAEISALLGGLPDVPPPAGFLDDVVDHPPLHAARTIVGLVTGSLLALAVLVAAVAAPPGSVIPPVDSLTSRHAASRADLLGESAPDDGAGGDASPGSTLCAPPGACGSEWVARRVDVPVSLPDGYRPEAGFAADDLEQAVYARNGDTVSVFTQPGVVDWTRLAAEGRRQLAGVAAWVDPDRQVTVLQVGDQVVTIVGLDAPEVERLVAAVPAEQASASSSRVRAVLGMLAEQLGLDVEE